MWNKIQRIYIGTDLVRPKWKPWPNTLGYFPLTDNILDQMGNYSPLIDAYVQQSIGYQITGNFQIKNTSGVNFVNEWIKFDSISSSETSVYVATIDACWWMSYNYKDTNSSHNQKFFVMNSSHANLGTVSYTTTTGTWYNIWVWFDNNVCYYYVNWQRWTLYSGSGVANFWGSLNIFAARGARTSKATLSDVIIESKARTAQEIADYYNQTKASYLWFN